MLSSSFGGDVKQYQVIVDQQALVNYNIPLKSLFEAIQANNQNEGANFIEHGDDQYVVRGLGLVKDVEDINKIVLDSRGGTPIRVGDVAQVQIGNEIRPGAVTKDGQGEVVTLPPVSCSGAANSGVSARPPSRVSAVASPSPEPC